MKKTPPGWPRISSTLFYRDPAAAIDWLCAAFGFEVQLKVEGEGGRIEHSELVYGDGLVMVGGDASDVSRPHAAFHKSPGDLGGDNTQSLFVYVDDIEAHHARARAAGATIAMELKVSDYGDDHWVDRGYGAIDLEGHRWWFAERVRTRGVDAA